MGSGPGLGGPLQDIMDKEKSAEVRATLWCVGREGSGLEGGLEERRGACTLVGCRGGPGLGARAWGRAGGRAAEQGLTSLLRGCVAAYWGGGTPTCACAQAVNQRMAKLQPQSSAILRRPPAEVLIKSVRLRRRGMGLGSGSQRGAPWGWGARARDFKDQGATSSSCCCRLACSALQGSCQRLPGHGGSLSPPGWCCLVSRER